LLRGTKSGLEFVFAAEEGEGAFAEAIARLGERPDFYRGSRATAIFGAAPPEDAAFAEFLERVRELGIELHGLHGPSELSALAERHALAYLGDPPRPVVTTLEPRKPRRVVNSLSERARSLEPDFAGARAEIARRRERGEESVRKPDFAGPSRGAVSRPAAAIAPVAVVAAGPATLYHRGTLRGGQTLQQIGNIVVFGDVNPGAELVASGDILVFGALRGTAHAGAQGDASARVLALELAPTQLRIAEFIGADDAKRNVREAEIASVRDGRITIGPARRGKRA